MPAKVNSETISASRVQTVARAPQVSRADLRDALEIAHSMLVVIEGGGSFSTAAWYERLGKIEKALGKKTARASIA